MDETDRWNSKRFSKPSMGETDDGGSWKGGETVGGSRRASGQRLENPTFDRRQCLLSICDAVLRFDANALHSEERRARIGELMRTTSGGRARFDADARKRGGDQQQQFVQDWTSKRNKTLLGIQMRRSSKPSRTRRVPSGISRCSHASPDVAVLLCSLTQLEQVACAPVEKPRGRR